MSRLSTKVSFLATMILFVVGIWIILSATSIGQKKGTQAIWDNGGSIETAKYNWIVQSSTENYRSAGTIIAVVGGAGMILSGAAIYRDSNGE